MNLSSCPCKWIKVCLWLLGSSKSSNLKFHCFAIFISKAMSHSIVLKFRLNQTSLTSLVMTDDKEDVLKWDPEKFVEWKDDVILGTSHCWHNGRWCGNFLSKGKIMHEGRQIETSALISLPKKVRLEKFSSCCYWCWRRVCKWNLMKFAIIIRFSRNYSLRKTQNACLIRSCYCGSRGIFAEHNLHLYAGEKIFIS